MEVRIENMIFGWHEKLPEMFIELLNTLVLTKDEQDVRGVMEVFARKKLFNALFAFGYGAHHLWVTQKKASDPDWKSHSTLTLLATQDLPTFLYYMIDPLKSWCWGAILFYPFKNSRFS